MRIAYAITAVLCFVVGATVFPVFGEDNKAKDDDPKRVVTITPRLGVSGTWWRGNQHNGQVAIYTDKDSSVVGFYKDAQKVNKGMDFAIHSNKDGIFFQVIDESGNIHEIPVTALLKLKEAPRPLPERPKGIGLLHPRPSCDCALICCCDPPCACGLVGAESPSTGEKPTKTDLRTCGVCQQSPCLGNDFCIIVGY